MQQAALWGILCLFSTELTAQPHEQNHALYFPGSDAYVTFGNPASLGLSQFTLETWFRRDGIGDVAFTGENGVYALPLVTKGVGEVDGDARDMNYFLGITGWGGFLAADFEEGSGGSSPGQNHAVVGVTPIEMGEWYHAAATYDGYKWRLYLNGMLENELEVNEPAQSSSIQYAALAGALGSTGLPNEYSGYFDGVIDEARIWNYARSPEEIQQTINLQITMQYPGLVARWGLNEGTGDSVYGSAGTGINGAIVGQNWSWTTDVAPLDITIDNPPLEPVLIGPEDLSTGVSLSPLLDVSVEDPEGMPLDVTYYGRRIRKDESSSFSIVVLPDAQYYTALIHGGTPDIFIAQTQWIAQNRDSLDIVFVDQVGDIVDHGDDYPEEWMNAWSAMSVLEDTLETGLPEGIPYSVDVGNHDQTPKNDPDGATFYYNKYFGEVHFAGRSYYGGHYGDNSDNHFVLFEGGGFGFIVISLEFDESPDSEVLDWADSLLTHYQDRWGIISSHHLIGTGNPASFSPHGQIIYDSLKHNPNLILMLCGHVPGEGRRIDTHSGNTVHTVLANYQNMPNGGDGWLRIMTFMPEQGIIRVKTYSPSLNEFDTDSTSQFTIECDLQWGTNWESIGTVGDVPSGSNSSLVWPGLCSLTEYEWYVSVSDSAWTVEGPVWSFLTRSEPPNVTVLWPNGGQELEAGAKVTLRWKASDDVEVTEADVYLSRTGPLRSYETIATGLVGVDSLDWTVTGPSTEDACIKVVVHDGDGNTSEDISDETFSIIEPTGGLAPEPSVGRLAFYLNSVNPVQTTAEFAVHLPSECPLNVTAYDIGGRVVDEIVDQVQRQGRHRILWELPSGSIASGVYFVRAATPEAELLQKVVVLR